MKLPVWSRIFPEGVGNYRRRRFLETGKGFWVERHTRGLRSSLPVYRDRINRATGRPHRDDAVIGRRADAVMTLMRQDRLDIRAALSASRAADRLRTAALTERHAAQCGWEHGPDAYRSAPSRQARSR